MCECAEAMNENLAPYGGQLDMALVITKPAMDLQSRFRVATKRIDSSKRKAVPPVIANFCPFCGEDSRKPVAEQEPSR